MRTSYFVGLDLGMRHDHTALNVVERREMLGERDPATYEFRKTITLRLRHVERIPLATEYVQVVERVAKVMRKLGAQGPAHLVVDATGVGAPVVELLRRAGMGCRLWPVSITGGPAEGYGDGYYRVPKRDLVVGLQVMFEQGALEIAGGLVERAALVKEMTDMRVKMTSRGHEQYEAGSSGQHDDIVSALSLACWAVRKVHRSGVGERRGRVV
uniref:Terminase large subunit gp17-like C-terminal domain-containing protein n=1 Tax=Solibacter usitatus (strain Ellin6076) TaxID=234267 RepID=Q01T17_SOLUE